MRALVAFGDITGFGRYAKSASRDPGEFQFFIKRLYYEFLLTRESRNDYGDYFKLLGDGVMLLTTNFENQKSIPEFLVDVIALTKRVNDTIRSMHYPKPTGFRMRLAMGHVHHVRIDGTHDYVGYPINMAFRMLNVASTIPIIAHESVKDEAGPKFDKCWHEIDTSQNSYSESVDIEDIKHSWELRCPELWDGSKTVGG